MTSPGDRYLTPRDREICARFNGCNQRELSEQYGITLVRLYQILQQVRSERARAVRLNRR